MFINDIAQEIFFEAGSPTYTSIPAIAFWIRSKVGYINNTIFESFTINANLEIVDCANNSISTEAVSIIKQLYRIYDYQQQITTALNALNADGILEVIDNFNGAGFRRVNKNEIVKTLLQARNQEREDLKALVSAYCIRKATPRQVAGDDTVPALDNAFRTESIRYY